MDIYLLVIFLIIILCSLYSNRENFNIYLGQPTKCFDCERMYFNGHKSKCFDCEKQNKQIRTVKCFSCIQ